MSADIRHTRRPILIRTAFWIILFLLVFVGTPVVMLRMKAGETSAVLKAQLAELRAQGKPTNAAELDAFYRIPEGRADSTDLWSFAISGLDPLGPREVIAPLPVVGTEEAEIPWFTDEWTQQSAVEELLTRFRVNLDAAWKATASNGLVRRDYDFRQGVGLTLPETQASRALARLLVLEANVQARHGDVDATLRTLLTMSALSETPDNEPFLVSHLVGMALDRMTANTTVDLLPHVAFSDAQLATLQQRLGDSWNPDTYARGIAGERAMGLMVLSGEDPSFPAPFFSGEGQQVRFLEMMRRMDDVVGSDHNTMMATARSVESEINAIPNTWLDELSYGRLKLVMGTQSALVDAFTRSEALALCGKTIVAVERFRRRNNRLPESLDDLVPEYLESVPADPFDQQPLRYTTTASGCTVYSIGRNGVDDGGRFEVDEDAGFSLQLVKLTADPGSDK